MELEKVEFLGLPIVGKVIKDLKLKSVFDYHFQDHGNKKTKTSDCLLIIVANIIQGRDPLYKIPQWLKNVHIQSITQNDIDEISDDQLGRSLDKLQTLDHGSLITEIVRNAVQFYNLNTSTFRNDSTTIKAHGNYPGRSSKKLEFKHGHSKDHRPDLKQILYSLTLTDDGMIPMHFKCYSGNVTDDKTHIETWNFLKNLTGKSNFWYVADSKVCTSKQLSHIVSNKGRVITIIPETWKETKDFKQRLIGSASMKKKEIYRRKVPGSWNSEETEYFCEYEGDFRTEKDNYKIYWIYSSEKKKRDNKSLEKILLRVEEEFSSLLSKLNKGKLKLKENIETKIEEILNRHNAHNLFHIKIGITTELEKKKIGRGRPTKDSKYETKKNKIYTLSVARNQGEIKKAKKTHGVFPLLAAGDERGLNARKALKAYKDQPHLEKKFSYLKSIHEIAPLYFKKINRIEAIMLLYFVALLIQSLVEKLMREAMKQNKLESVPLFPEDRPSHSPTASLLMYNFGNLTAHRLIDSKTGVVAKRFRDSFSEKQRLILELLGITESEFWGSEFRPN